MRGVAAGALVLALGLSSGLLSGCDGTPSADPTTTAPAPTPTTTPLSSYSTPIEATVARALFCDRVSPTAIEHAIGGPPESTNSWVNGDRTPTGQTGREYGCTWSTAGSSGGGHASAWVFAPPITRARATTLAGTSPDPTCHRLSSPSLPPFGTPSTAYSCRLDSGATLFHLAGLFGDAWLTCEVRFAAGADNPADEFCGAILAAASSTVG
jgi:hypothetical protein